MMPHHRILSATLVFALFAWAALADPKHDRKKHEKNGKHAVPNCLFVFARMKIRADLCAIPDKLTSECK